MGKKLVMAQKRGETRALCLGVAMVVCAAITYYILGTTVLPLYQKSVWTQESTCHLVETNIKDQEELEGRKVPQYPCLWVNVSAVGRWAMLYHTEDTRDQNQQCSYIPRNLDNYQTALVDVKKVRANFYKHHNFYCFSAPQVNETSVVYQRLYGPQILLFSFFWPTFLLTGGLLIIAMVKLNRSLSVLAAQK
ncbi:potassium large conductance calcium-activated channel, subfamily M, beta member 1, isoform CRA_a [Rattus norvegicus]|uniref:Calcium-activated potassium channel subunit beta-1 n=2 Tax=Rattus norvegicus TaxID=10116 RepID=KCMB1_RAT|nr:calcium-activated potassium channel subunit beta-1 [Rattus norvegicus]XP_006246151.1 calcium-activated potassium channel subunit beta-1 isoform X1 [Rattus norvegicus]P97678.4 RecName: Full=Calcium-activated potassium channel subunit beta-1; AltName: Full=BK channel subunit beta-1; Short=BKbeta; Short=BKbeta1; AltName: Full=Calcium-activated potassium channel, subfamily M subunit beta-1; Short=Calcium-activated potassium channel subunit beta; AltName: Full=Charybdotoxin receptor subunit beta-1;|eukprot:NP_062146.1 calcium-activated potassium channel subunit beta-1 [Rattus norvegicus]